MSALDHGGCVEFDEHARPGELTDDEEGVCREGWLPYASARHLPYSGRKRASVT
jgi:hypothetical protein